MRAGRKKFSLCSLCSRSSLFTDFYYISCTQKPNDVTALQGENQKKDKSVIIHFHNKSFGAKAKKEIVCRERRKLKDAGVGKLLWNI